MNSKDKWEKLRIANPVDYRDILICFIKDSYLNHLLDTLINIIFEYKMIGCYWPMYTNVVWDKWVKNEGKWLVCGAPYVLQMVELNKLILWNFTGLYYFLLISILQIETNRNSVIVRVIKVIQF